MIIPLQNPNYFRITYREKKSLENLLKTWEIITMELEAICFVGKNNPRV